MAIVEEQITIYRSTTTGKTYESREEAERDEFREMLLAESTHAYGSATEPIDVINYILSHYKLEKKL